MDVSHHSFQAGEPGECQDLAEPMKSGNGLDPLATLDLPPRVFGQFAGAEVRVDETSSPKHSVGQPSVSQAH